MLTLRAILRLIRLDSCLLAFLAIFLPLLIRGNDFAQSLRRATPLLFICVCTFIVNDLDDLERDRINHPERPLPARHLSPAFAVVLYYISLGVALFSTRQYVEPNTAFLYYALTTLSISYGYIVDCFPSIKSAYVAATSSTPILIVASWYPEEIRLYILAVTVFFLTLGREICMDIKDRPGDTVSVMQRFEPKPLAIIAFSLQTFGLLLLTTQALRLGYVIDLLIMAFLLILSGVYWFRFSRYKLAIILMKIQFFVGLYFLT